MLRLLLAVSNGPDRKDPPAWIETLPDGATQDDVVKFIAGLVEGFNDIQKGEWEIQPINVRLIDVRENSETVLLDVVMI